MCCERFRREVPRAQAFTPILFNIYVLCERCREGPRTTSGSPFPSCSTSMCSARGLDESPQSISVYPDLAQHLCAARDVDSRPQNTHLPRSCSTSMCCDWERFGREVFNARAFTPMLFNIYMLLREIVGRKAWKHTKHLPRSCSTSMCCERFRREVPKTQAFAVPRFCSTSICSARDVGRKDWKHTSLARSCSTSVFCWRFRREVPKTQAFTPILFNIYVCSARDVGKAPKHTGAYPRSCSTSCVLLEI